MATTRPFAYNTGTTIANTTQVGTIAVGDGENRYDLNYGGVKWWNGPDEDNGYIITYPNASGNQPNPDSLPAYLGFKRSVLKTENSFVQLTNNAYGQSFTNGNDAYLWLSGNGYWSSWVLTPVSSSLVLYYDPSNVSSYSGTGTNLNDLSGNGLSGSLSNITYASPYFSYNGSTSTISTVDNALLEPGSGDWTVEAWIYHSVFSGSSRIILAKTNGGNAADWGYGLRTNNAGATYFEVGNGTTSLTSPSFTASTGTWYQVVGVWTNVASNSIALYVNGASQGSNSHSFTSVKNTTSPLYLGSFNAGQFSQWFNGRMGIVRFYSKALSASEISQNFNADKSKYGL